MPDQAPNHDDIKSLLAVAGELTQWQHAAQTLPLTEVRALYQDGIAHLGCVLNDFNEVYSQRDTTASDTDIAAAIAKAVRQASMAAIYTLAVLTRYGETAALN